MPWGPGGLWGHHLWASSKETQEDLLEIALVLGSALGKGFGLH